MLEIGKGILTRGRELYSFDSHQLNKGKLIALIGANGAGKSSFLDAIAQGDKAFSFLKWNDSDLQNTNSTSRARYLALVESKFSGVSFLSTHSYLKLGRTPHTGFSGRLSSIDHEVVNAIAGKLELTHLLKQDTTTLSDGERQRASIARALVQETPIVLLDEPTSFLDYPHKRSIMKLLQTIAHEQDKLVIIASHDLDQCLEYCDELMVIAPKMKSLQLIRNENFSLESLLELAFS